MLTWHQGCVLSEVGFFPQVLDHCGGGVIQRNSSLAGGRFQLSHFHVPAWFSLQSIPAPDLFHATLQVENPPFQVDVAVEEAQQFSRSQACVQHEDVGRRLLVFALSIGESGEGFPLEFGNLGGGKDSYLLLLRHTLLVLGGKEI